MKVRSEVVQMRASGTRNRPMAPEAYCTYVEEPSADFSFQSAQMCDRSSSFMNHPG